MQVPHGDGQLLGRNPLLQLADPEHRVETETVGLHDAALSSGTRPNERVGRGRQWADLANRLTKERVDGRPEFDGAVNQRVRAGNVGVDLNEVTGVAPRRQQLAHLRPRRQHRRRSDCRSHP